MPKSAIIPPTEVNEARRRLAVMELDRLLKEATDPRFSGEIVVAVKSHKGHLQQPRATAGGFIDPELRLAFTEN